MKQHISPEQAREIKEEQFYSFFDEIARRKDYATYHHKKMTIGKMMEILEKKFYCVQIQMLNKVTQPKEKVSIHLWYQYDSDECIQVWGENEVAALWAAVKAMLER